MRPSDVVQEIDEDKQQKAIEETGCAKLNDAVLLCYDEHRDWRQCRDVVEQFRQCMDKYEMSRGEKTAAKGDQTC